VIVSAHTANRSFHRIALITLAAVIAIVPLSSVGSAGTPAKTRRASVGNKEQQSPNGGIYPSISGSGRFVVFETNSGNLVPGDTNTETDVFVRDRKTGKTERVSLRSNGRQANSWSGYASISATGRFVLFTSTATDLVRNDTNGFEDLFVHDRVTGTTRLVSVRSNGNQANATVGFIDPGSISANGRYITFASKASNLVKDDDNAVADVFVRDRVARTTIRVSVSSAGDEGNGSSRDPSISGDGKFVAFASDATNLVGSDGNGEQDIFVHNLKRGTTRRISVSSADEEADSYSSYSSISADGRYVAFDSFAENLIANDTNDATDVFVRDRKRRRTVRVSLTNAGAEGDKSSNYPFLSANGKFVAFQSDATNLVGNDTNDTTDIYVRGPLA
jgi:Tol biopolymer transport system component